MHCKKLKATISETTCIKRQKKKNPATRNTSPLYDECQNCEQGKEIAQQFQSQTAPSPSLSVTLGESKICPRCKKEKSLNDFHKYSYTKDGRQPICKECRHEIDGLRKVKRHPESGIEPEMKPAPDQELKSEQKSSPQPKKNPPPHALEVIPEKTHICYRCKEEKPYSAFHKDLNSKKGIQNRCKQCKNIMQQDYRRSLKMAAAPASSQSFPADADLKATDIYSIITKALQSLQPGAVTITISINMQPGPAHRPAL